MVTVLTRAGKAGEEILATSTELLAGGVGVAAGAIAAKYSGRFVEEIYTKNLSASSTTTTKVIAWALNNSIKAVGAYIFYNYSSTIPEESLLLSRGIEGLSYGIAGDIVFDTYERSKNDWATPTPTLLKANDSRLQAMLNENSQLKDAVHNMNQRLKEKESSLNSLNQTLREKENSLHSLNQNLIERGNTIQNLNQKLIERSQEVPYKEPLIPYSPETRKGIPPSIAQNPTIHSKEAHYQFAEPDLQAPTPTEKKYQFATANAKVSIEKALRNPEILIQSYGFTRGE